MLDLSNRTALITGANQGIGWEIARLFARQGARVAVNYPRADARPRALVELGAGAIAVQADVSKVAEIDRMFDEIGSAFSRLDVLVNNAGIFPRSNVLELDEQEWDLVLDTNLKGTFYCSQRAARIMVEQKHGKIVNVSS